MDSPDFQCILVNPEVNLAPHAALRAAVLASIPLAFTLRCPAGASAGCCREGTLIPVLSTARQSLPAAMRGDQQVQWALRTAMGNVDLRGLLTPLVHLYMHCPIAWQGIANAREGGSGRLSVLKFGTVRSSPIRPSRLSTNPVVWRSAMPNMPGALPVRG